MVDLTDPRPREEALSKHMEEVRKNHDVFLKARGLKRAAAARQLSDSLAAAFQVCFGLAACLARIPEKT